jgi:hypothetical protein
MDKSSKSIKSRKSNIKSPNNPGDGGGGNDEYYDEEESYDEEGD